MKKIKHTFIAVFIASFSVAALAGSAPVSAREFDPGSGGGGGVTCTPSSGRFLTFPTWYKGLQLNVFSCAPMITQLNDIWKIVLNVVEMMMQIAGYVAAGFITWGGFKYIKSQGNPQNIASAKSTIMSAAIGLGVAISAVAIINFIGTTIK